MDNFQPYSELKYTRGNKIRTLQVRPQPLAAVYKNDRFSRCVAVLESTLMQHFLCCERTQRTSRIHRLGSNPAFAF